MTDEPTEPVEHTLDADGVCTTCDTKAGVTDDVKATR